MVGPLVVSDVVASYGDGVLSWDLSRHDPKGVAGTWKLERGTRYWTSGSTEAVSRRPRRPAG